jgi:hypothetical protein
MVVSDEVDDETNIIRPTRWMKLIEDRRTIFPIGAMKNE